MREFKCEYYSCVVPDRCCLFCDNCTDVYFDSGGPYLFHCEALGHLVNWQEHERCGQFVEEDDETV